MKVLIADDNPDILDYFTVLLQDKFLVVTAKDGKEALALKNSDKSIVLVLTDIQMPIIDGLQLCREVKKFDPTAIVIGFTGHYGKATAFEARDAGFDDIYTKPIDAQIVLRMVEDSFEKIQRWTAKK